MISDIYLSTPISWKQTNDNGMTMEIIGSWVLIMWKLLVSQR